MRDWLWPCNLMGMLSYKLGETGPLFSDIIINMQCV